MNGPARRQAGFSLLEMIVVLVVLALAVSLVVARGPARSPTLTLRAAAGQVADRLRLARADAIAANRPVMVVIDTARRQIEIDRRPLLALPSGIAVTALTTAGQALGARAGITFAPDGSSTGGRIDLLGRERRMQVGVDWLTGRVSIANAR
ncbi:MAG: GspH/FimT family pseudopilin [Acidisphaera sp.]|nr:GspH/FimT family pseudopilin [Acidisphaera sp.]